jgi:hypothetical protein
MVAIGQPLPHAGSSLSLAYSYQVNSKELFRPAVVTCNTSQGPVPPTHTFAVAIPFTQRGKNMNSIIYIVGLVVVIAVVLSFLGLA